MNEQEKPVENPGRRNFLWGAIVGAGVTFIGLDYFGLLVAPSRNPDRRDAGHFVSKNLFLVKKDGLGGEGLYLANRAGEERNFSPMYDEQPVIENGKVLDHLLGDQNIFSLDSEGNHGGIFRVSYAPGCYDGDATDFLGIVNPSGKRKVSYLDPVRIKGVDSVHLLGMGGEGCFAKWELQNALPVSNEELAISFTEERDRILKAAREYDPIGN